MGLGLAVGGLQGCGRPADPDPEAWCLEQSAGRLGLGECPPGMLSVVRHHLAPGPRPWGVWLLGCSDRWWALCTQPQGAQARCKLLSGPPRILLGHGEAPPPFPQPSSLPLF